MVVFEPNQRGRMNYKWNEQIIELASASFLAAALTANKTLLAVAVPAGVKRYLRAKYTVTGSAATAGKVTCFLTDAVDMH